MPSAVSNIVFRVYPQGIRGLLSGTLWFQVRWETTKRSAGRNVLGQLRL